MKLYEVKLTNKAGVVPYYIDSNGIPLMMFMVPSDPHYGGTKFQIAKGHIDPGEDEKQAAMREGAEELGLIYSNIHHSSKIVTTTIHGLDDTYSLTVYAALIKDSENFNEPHFETGKRDWLTLSDFLSVGRENQIQVVKQIHNYILRADGRDQIS